MCEAFLHSALPVDACFVALAGLINVVGVHQSCVSLLPPIHGLFQPRVGFWPASEHATATL